MNEPIRPELNPDNIPARLKKLPWWVVWGTPAENTLDDAGEIVSLHKQPFGTGMGSGAKGWEQVKNLLPFEEALEKRNCKAYNGIGLALHHAPRGDCQMVAIDLDAIYLPDGTMKPAEVAGYKLAIAAGFYLERSPSGRGVRGFGQYPPGMGELRELPHSETAGEHEFYNAGSKRFLTVTGNRISEQAAVVEIDADKLAQLHKVLEGSRGDNSEGRHQPQREGAKTQLTPSREGVQAIEPDLDFEDEYFLNNGELPETLEDEKPDRSAYALAMCNRFILQEHTAPEVYFYLHDHPAMLTWAEFHWPNNPTGYLWNMCVLPADNNWSPHDADDNILAFERLPTTADGDLAISSATETPSAKWDDADPMATLQALALDDEDFKNMEDTKAIIPDLVAGGHVITVVAPPNAGKTTLFAHLAGEIVAKGYQVLYFNADSSGPDLKPYYRQAAKHGWTLVSPDMKNISAVTIVNQLKAIAKQAKPAGLTDQVIIIDTLKQFGDVIDKKNIKALYRVFRSLSAKGATVIALGHTNKKKDIFTKQDVYEGTGDVKSDSDELIFLDAKVQEDKSMLISTRIDKKRFDGVPTTWLVSPDRTEITRQGEYVDLKNTGEELAQWKKQYNADKHIIEAIRFMLGCQETELLEAKNAAKSAKRRWNDDDTAAFMWTQGELAKKVEAQYGIGRPAVMRRLSRWAIPGPLKQWEREHVVQGGQAASGGKICYTLLPDPLQVEVEAEAEEVEAAIGSGGIEVIGGKSEIDALRSFSQKSAKGETR